MPKGSGTMNPLYKKVVGVSFENRQSIVKGLLEGEILILAREFTNQYDPNAIMVLRSDGKQIGYIDKETAYDMAPAIDSGLKYIVTVKDLTGFGKDTKGVNIEIQKVSNLESSEGHTGNNALPTSSGFSEPSKFNCITCGREYKTEEQKINCCKV